MVVMGGCVPRRVVSGAAEVERETAMEDWCKMRSDHNF